jgi:hypothetical protein
LEIIYLFSFFKKASEILTNFNLKLLATFLYLLFFLNQGSYVIVGPVHDVVDPVVEPQYELGPRYQPQEGQRQGQQVIPAPKGKTFQWI